MWMCINIIWLYCHRYIILLSGPSNIINKIPQKNTIQHIYYIPKHISRNFSWLLLGTINSRTRTYRGDKCKEKCSVKRKFLHLFIIFYMFSCVVLIDAIINFFVVRVFIENVSLWVSRISLTLFIDVSLLFSLK